MLGTKFKGEIMTEKTTFAKRLRQTRKNLGYTKLTVAVHCEATEEDVADFEKGKKEPTLGQLIDICQLFECSTDYVLGLTDVERREAFENVNMKTLQKYNNLDDKERMYINTLINHAYNFKGE